MIDLVRNFPGQLREAISIGRNASIDPSGFKASSVLICGLGGSGIGGTIVSQLLAPAATVPVTVFKDYFIPGFVTQNTLTIISSYSGNTEETVQCMEDAIRKGCRIVCITSGGKLEQLAEKHGISLIKIPGGMPPRACLGYSMTQLFFVLAAFGVVGTGILKDLESAVQLIERRAEHIRQEAEAVAKKFHGKFPVIYATTRWEGVAIRLRQQLNENSKILCSHHIIPEMNHNELVGWAGKNENVAVLIMRDKDEYVRNNTRIDINKQVIGKYASSLTEIWSEGKSDIEKAIYLIHLGDWISVLLAELRGVDAVEVRVIDFLKAELGKS